MFNKHSLVEGAKNLSRSFWLSITAITVLVVSLSSVAIIIILRTSISHLLRQLDNNIEITIFLEPGLDEETIAEIKKDLDRIPQIESWRYISNEEAKRELVQNADQAEGFRDTILSIDFEINLDYFLVKPDKVENYNVVYNLLSSEKYQPVFKRVLNKQDFINRLQTLYYWTNIIGLIVVIIFSLIAVLVMMNILKIAVYNYKSEIEIMRLVGATNSYIQGPFIAQGTYFALIASIIVLIIFVPLSNLVANYFTTNVEVNETNLLPEIYLSLGIMVFVSVLVGMLTSFFSTQKYLQQ